MRSATPPAFDGIKAAITHNVAKFVRQPRNE
jgi:hypothetical protein